MLDALVKCYTLFDDGFQILIPSPLDSQAKENLSVLIWALKIVVLYQPQGVDWDVQLEMTCGLVSHLLDLDLTKVRGVVNSPCLWSLPILPLKSPKLDHNEESGVSTDTVIQIILSHKELALHCLQALSGMSPVQPDIAALYTYLLTQLVYHILKTHPSSEILQAILNNVGLFPANEDARKILAWGKVCIISSCCEYQIYLSKLCKSAISG